MNPLVSLFCDSMCEAADMSGHTHIHTYIHTHIHTYTHTYIHTHRTTWVRRDSIIVREGGRE